MSEKPGPLFVLVVTRGRDAGARVVVGATPKIAGRSRSSDLLLSDPGVSRRHFSAVATDKGLEIEVLEGATPIVVHDSDVTKALISPGDSFVIADTLLGVLPPSGAATKNATTVQFLFSGLAADVKSLRSIAELLDALDDARDEDAIESALVEWSKLHAGTSGARIALTAELAREPAFAGVADDSIVTVARAQGADVSVPARGSASHAIVFTFDKPVDAIGADTTRLLAVCGRVAASALARVAAQRVLEDDVASLRAMALGSARAFLGRSPAALEVSRLMERLSASDSTALILGESGTGKSFAARLIHEASARAKEPFRVINCAAIPENLVESELFGHERGAFSGAVAMHVGAFESAGRGTILLDEIGELPLGSQAKLLRVLEERMFERVGSNRPIELRARVLAATNRDLKSMISARTFREDLFYRVSVVTMRVPPLRDRGEDVVILAEQLLADLSRAAGRRVTGFSKSALAAIRAHAWPGNVRELRNAIEHALVLGATSTIEASDLPENVNVVEPANGEVAPNVTATGSVALPARLDWLEKQAIDAAIAASGGKRAKAAQLLGIDRVTLYKKLQKSAAEKK